MKKRMFVIGMIFMMVFATILGGCAQQQAGSETTLTEESSSEGSQVSNENNSESGIDYPEKQIEIIVPFAAGGGTDAVARVLAESLSSTLDEEVIVVNREGGNGAIGMNEGLTAKPDGYTLTMVTREVTTLPLLGSAPFETMDFKFVSNVNVDNAVLVVPDDSSYQSLNDLVSALKENPGNLKFAASVVPNYYGIQFSEGAGVEFVTVPYQGAAPAIKELLGGGADFGIYNPGEVVSQVDSGDLRVLAVMAEDRISTFPDAPTFKEEGFDIVSGTYRGIAVPPETPEEIVKVLEDAIAKIVEDEGFIEFMENSSLGIGYMNSEEFKEYISKDIDTLTPIIEIAKQK